MIGIRRIMDVDDVEESVLEDNLHDHSTCLVVMDGVLIGGAILIERSGETGPVKAFTRCWAVGDLKPQHWIGLEEMELLWVAAPVYHAVRGTLERTEIAARELEREYKDLTARALHEERLIKQGMADSFRIVVDTLSRRVDRAMPMEVSESPRKR